MGTRQERNSDVPRHLAGSPTPLCQLASVRKTEQSVLVVVESRVSALGLCRLVRSSLGVASASAGLKDLGYV